MWAQNGVGFEVGLLSISWSKATFNTSLSLMFRRDLQPACSAHNPLHWQLHKHSHLANSVSFTLVHLISVQSYWLCQSSVDGRPVIRCAILVPAIKCPTQTAWGAGLYDWAHEVPSQCWVDNARPNAASTSGTPWRPCELPWRDPAGCRTICRKMLRKACPDHLCTVAGQL